MHVSVALIGVRKTIEPAGLDVGAARPRGMGAAADLVRQANAADRSVGQSPGVDEQAFRLLRLLIGDEAHQIAVVLVRRTDPRRERRLGAIAIRAEVESRSRRPSPGRA